MFLTNFSFGLVHIQLSYTKIALGRRFVAGIIKLSSKIVLIFKRSRSCDNLGVVAIASVVCQHN